MDDFLDNMMSRHDNLKEMEDSGHSNRNTD